MSRTRLNSMNYITSLSALLALSQLTCMLFDVSKTPSETTPASNLSLNKVQILTEDSLSSDGYKASDVDPRLIGIHLSQYSDWNSHHNRFSEKSHQQTSDSDDSDDSDPSDPSETYNYDNLPDDFDDLDSELDDIPGLDVVSDDVVSDEEKLKYAKDTVNGINSNTSEPSKVSLREKIEEIWDNGKSDNRLTISSEEPDSESGSKESVLNSNNNHIINLSDSKTSESSTFFEVVVDESYAASKSKSLTPKPSNNSNADTNSDKKLSDFINSKSMSLSVDSDSDSSKSNQNNNSETPGPGLTRNLIATRGDVNPNNKFSNYLDPENFQLSIEEQKGLEPLKNFNHISNGYHVINSLGGPRLRGLSWR